MSKTSRLAPTILLVSLILGLLGSLLLRATPWGLNATLWIMALALSIGVITHRHADQLTGGGRWLLEPAVFFALGLAWRDSRMLQAGNLLAALIALALVATRTRQGQVRVAGIIDYIKALIVAGKHTCFDARLIFRDIQWPTFIVVAEIGVALLIGLLIVLPLWVIFGGLLASADAVFQALIDSWSDWDIAQIMPFLLTIMAVSWLVAGFLQLTFLAKDTALITNKAITLGAVEIGVALGALDVLFFAFVVVQLRYFFGGAEAMGTLIKLSYAEYARRGFFELAVVAALAWLLLLAAQYVLRRDDSSGVRAFNVLASIMIGLVFIIILSALRRIQLYTDEFGLTELRLYTTAFMVWLALVLAWLGATLLRGQRNRFAFGALLAGFVVLIGLNVINPDDLIVRANAARINAPNPLDTEYVTALSADSVPALIEALPSLAKADRCAVAKWLIERWSPPAVIDPLTWNWSRTQAWQAVAAQKAYLQAACPAAGR